MHRVVNSYNSPFSLWALAVWLLFFAVAAIEASAQYRFDQFTNNDGLPQNTVSAIAQTSDGYLWFATYDGLARYDGVRFTVFDKGNTPGIRSNLFMSLYKDARGTLWAGTFDGGLVRYRDGVFTTFTAENGLPKNDVGRIQPDADGSPVIFVGGIGHDYLRWNDDSPLESLNIFRWTEEDSLEALDAREFYEYVDRANSRWVFESGKLIRFKGDQKTEFSTKLSLNEFFRFRYEDSAGNLWFGTNGDGIYCVTGDTLRHYTDSDGVPTGLLIKIGGEDSEGNIWFYARKGGLLRYANGQFTRYLAKNRLKDSFIRDVFCDREGTIWVGTNSAGLYRLTKKFLTVYTEADGLEDDIVYPICQDASGSIWIGSGSGLARFADGRFTSYSLAIGSNSKVQPLTRGDKRQSLGVRSIYADREGRLWFGSTSILKFENGEFSLFSKHIGQLNVILRDSAGNLWTGGNKGLLKERDGLRTTYTVKDGLPNDEVTSLYEDSRGNLWIGTIGGLARLTGGRFTVFTEKDGLVGGRIRSIYEDRDGDLWIGTFDSGLSRFRGGQFTSYTTREGLFNNGVFQILEDSHDNFWISCNRGIYRVSRRQLNDYAEGKVAFISCVAYGTSDGMLSIECNGEQQPAGIKAADGKLWFPTQQGVVVIDPELVPYNRQPPLISIESVIVEGKATRFETGITLDPGLTDLEINYSAPGSVKAGYVQFKYKLVGLNDQWINAGRQRAVRYSHLPPGHYTFKVIAASSDGVWNETGATLEIYKLPYFYQTGWFFALCLAASVIIAASIYALRIQRLKASARRLTKLVAERTAELVERTEQLEDANDNLEKLATLDGLTNIANRRRFMEFLEQEWQRSKRTQTPISLLLLDVDYFKSYNDTYGHQSGDECLKRVAAVVSQSVKRAIDLAARYGGEEFVVILTEPQY